MEVQLVTEMPPQVVLTGREAYINVQKDISVAMLAIIHGRVPQNTRCALQGVQEYTHGIRHKMP